MTTNGVALTAKRALKLKEAGMDTVNISLDTLEPMKAEFITRRPSTFHKERGDLLEISFIIFFWPFQGALLLQIKKRQKSFVNRHPSVQSHPWIMH